MIHHSPLPDVEIPDLPLTEYVLAGGVGQPGKPALIDGASGRVMTYGELDDAIRSLAGARKRPARRDLPTVSAALVRS